ncbi:MAG: tryptophan--tRNA ligase, partial [Gammaproteobacteria bacterium]
RILLTDSNDDIATKISKAKSDSHNMPSDIEGVNNRPEINNLLNIYAAVSNQDKSEVINQFSGKEISYFKSELKDVVINLIEPISSRIQDIKNDKTLLINTLKLGSDKAREIATKTISDVDNLMGLNIE